ncbi:TniB family NTP-binding protein [Novosphingobium sp. NBM11]|uniref:TniB family NTP-binding protein n=1 Tax=Novosphingobium sp. NBM11 TaxID=2596914 RepID=UPI0021022CC1|nr:TniB family NTP-binding protein [Novosphingobium sp. NBM11]
MNYAEFDHISLRSLRSLARRTLGEFGTKVLVLDEIDKMLAGSPRQQRIFLNTIRFLTNDLRIPIVCAGTEGCAHRDPHRSQSRRPLCRFRACPMA